ncbi:hypothetical protein [Pseudomonas sp. TE3911]
MKETANVVLGWKTTFTILYNGQSVNQSRGYRPPQRGTTLNLEEAAFFRMMILNGASRYVYAADTRDIEAYLPRTVSRELYDEEQKLWADWHESQSREEAEYPDLKRV